jgi:hypothetical protein
MELWRVIGSCQHGPGQGNRNHCALGKAKMASSCERLVRLASTAVQSCPTRDPTAGWTLEKYSIRVSRICSIRFVLQKNMITCLLCRRISCSHAVTSPTSRGTWKPLAVSACKSGFSRLNTQHMRRGIKVLEIPDKGRAGLTCDAAIPGAKRRSRCCVSWNGRFCFRTGRGRKEKKTGQMGDKQIVSKKGIIINV